MIPAIAVWAANDPQQSQMAKLIDDAGPIAGLFVLVLLIAMYFLWRSLNKQMKKIDPSLPAGEHDEEQAMDQKITEQAVERGAADDQQGR